MRCPRCQRPLADTGDGVYICCADARQQWRCTACAKVSEGFAFPYGRCTQCGGVLEAVDAPGPRADAAIDGIRMAFEIELGGRAFYQRAAADSTDPQMRDLFGRFALMEGEHMETLARRYHLDIPEPSSHFRIELAAIFAEVESRPEDPGNLFRIAIALERRASAFFSERAARAAAGAAERQLFLELAAEERAHAEQLETEYARWQAGQPGLFSVELRGAPPAGATARTPLNAAALLLGDQRDDQIALVCGDQEVSRGALREAVARCAGLWRARGIGPGDRVAIKLDDGLDWVTAFLGTLWSGAIAVAVNPRVPAPEWQYILDEAGFSLILEDDGEATPPPWRQRVLLRAEWRRALPGAELRPAQAMDPEAPAFWCHSSGTSGKPKAVIHAHRFARQIETVSRDDLGIGADDRLYASSKLFFSYPQTNSLFAGLKLGATVILDPVWPTADSVIATVRAQRPTVLFSVPSLYRNLLHAGLAPAVADAGVRLCVSAGEALPEQLRAAWRDQTGLTIVNGYGASETLALVMVDDGGSTGLRPSHGFTVAAASEVAAGAPTRLMIRGATLALGYLDRPQAQAEAFRDGAFSPADLFVANADGGWRFAGREDSLVKIGGRWVNLVDLEQRLVAQAGEVVDGAAVCVPDADGVDALAFFFVADDPATAHAALRAGVAGLPPHQQPRWLHPLALLPRTPTGKLLRRKLRELHLEIGDTHEQIRHR